MSVPGWWVPDLWDEDPLPVPSSALAKLARGGDKRPPREPAPCVDPRRPAVPVYTRHYPAREILHHLRARRGQGWR